MLVRDAIEEKQGFAPSQRLRDAGVVSLPRTLKHDSASARLGLLQRLAASRLFARGDRSGSLRSAQARSGRPFRFDVRQRVIVKALISRHLGRGAERSAALGRHIVYLGRQGAGELGERPEFFDRETDGLDPAEVSIAWAQDRHHFRLIISPEHGDRIADLPGYVREVMTRVAEDLGQPDLVWMATCHFDTDKPHAHVLVRGRKANGRDLVVPGDYIAYGIRGRAQEVAQERLGDLSRADAERRVWSQTRADRFTGLDRRLIDAADVDGRVSDGIGKGPWHALSRGRLRHLEGLDLAAWVPGGFRLDQNLELRLRRLQLDKDLIRTMHGRRLQGANDVRSLREKAVTGRVVSTGHHDELGASPFVVVRDSSGIEHYARLNARAVIPNRGEEVTVRQSPSGSFVERGAQKGLGTEL